MFSTPLNQFRAIAYTEGVSFLVLLFIAMPLKYFAEIPMAVKIVGWIHGILFILYWLAVARVARADQWSNDRIRLALIASVLPFGPFIFDSRLRGPAPGEQNPSAEPTAKTDSSHTAG